MPPTHILDDRARLVKTFVQLIEAAATDAVAARGRFGLAVTGGRDAEVFLPALRGARVDWARADVFWGDERAVAPTDPDSNYGQAQAAWLSRSAVSPERMHRMAGDAVDLDAAARDYEATLTRMLGMPPAFDAILLGMGADGHVCSLFPGHPLLAERTRLVAAVYDSPKPPPRRLTLTLPAIVAARLAIVMALGDEKRRALETARHDAGSDLPIAHVMRRASRVVVLTDGA